MHVFDFVEAWILSLRAIFSASGVSVTFDRSPVDRANPSCCLNVRSNDHEADLVVWESGEAELVVGKVGEEPRQLHFDDIKSRDELSGVLSRVVEAVMLGRVS